MPYFEVRDADAAAASAASLGAHVHVQPSDIPTWAGSRCWPTRRAAMFSVIHITAHG